MMFDTQTDPAHTILAFGIFLFLALICLFEWQRRRRVVRARMNRNLRIYMANQNHQAA